MLTPLNELSPEELENLKIRLQSLVLEIKNDITRRQARLDDRLNRQGQEALAFATLETNLANATRVRDELVANGASAEAISIAEELVTASQLAVDENEAPPSALTMIEAYIQQADIDELIEGREVRENLITQIEALQSP